MIVYKVPKMSHPHNLPGESITRFNIDKALCNNYLFYALIPSSEATPVMAVKRDGNKLTVSGGANGYTLYHQISKKHHLAGMQENLWFYLNKFGMVIGAKKDSGGTPEVAGFSMQANSMLVSGTGANLLSVRPMVYQDKQTCLQAALSLILCAVESGTHGYIGLYQGKNNLMVLCADSIPFLLSARLPDSSISALDLSDYNESVLWLEVLSHHPSMRESISKIITDNNTMQDIRRYTEARVK